MRYARWFRVWAWPALFCVSAPLACSGAEFVSSQATGGASERGGGGAGEYLQAGRDVGGFGRAAGGGGGAPDSGGGASAIGAAGQSSNGGVSASANGDAGNSFNGDAGAESTVPGCVNLQGVEFEGHCYVDATVDSASQQQAVARCAQLSIDAMLPGHLLVLDSAQEQSFVLHRFMVSFTDESDAWLGLTCHELDEPDINACYCSGCAQAVLSEKQQAWHWLGGASSTFGWVNGNPNGGYRCAALAYNPDSTIWGWVDRPCDKASFTGVSGHPHGYRTLCELEP